MSTKLIIPNSQDLSGSLGIIKGANDYNAPQQASKTLIIPVAQIAFYQDKVNKNPDYFKDEGIRFVKVLKDEDFGRYMHRRLEKQGYSSLSDIEVVKSLGLSVNQDLITY